MFASNFKVHFGIFFSLDHFLNYVFHSHFKDKNVNSCGIKI